MCACFHFLLRNISVYAIVCCKGYESNVDKFVVIVFCRCSQLCNSKEFKLLDCKLIMLQYSVLGGRLLRRCKRAMNEWCMMNIVNDSNCTM